jgi:hypothetical protein
MRLLNLLAVAVVLLLYMVVGYMDMQDNQKDALAYCQNVKAGIWPDFRHAYQAECVTKIDE